MDSSATKNNINKKKARAKSLYNKRDFHNASKFYLELCRDTTDAEPQYMMGLLYGNASNFIQAEQHLLHALRLEPTYHQAWNQLGITQLAQRKFNEAISSFENSIDIKPANTQALNNLGNLYREVGQFNEAEKCYKKSLSFDSKDFIALNNIANIFLTQCRYDRAERFYLKAIKIKKDYFDAYYNLGATYQSKGEHKKAINYYKRAQKIRPDDIQPLVAQANSYEKQGNINKSLDLLNPLLTRNIITPDIADVYSKICLKNKNFDKAIQVASKCLAALPGPIHEQSLHFNLGDLYDKKGNYDKALIEYNNANSMRSYQYNRDYFEHLFENIKQTFKSKLQSHTIAECLSDKPIFIIGMPRSGTTLIEQILSSHSIVCGAGETPYIAEIAENAIVDNTDIHYPECIEHLNTKQLTLHANDYLKKLDNLGLDCKYISDKMPHNFMYVGLIKMLFPNSKIIHCLRNPLDVCLSIYFHNFNQNHPYSDNFSNLGHYYNLYRDLMSFWSSQYDDLIIDISYEELLADAETSVRKLLDFLGLEWQENCLKFYENKRTVSTPSYSQVNQPLYTTSMERWRNYNSHIDELKTAIDKIYIERYD